ncbi:MAG: glycosyltransferase family 4 protein [Bacteroidota bacterium]
MNFILLNPGESELENHLLNNNFKVDRINYTGKKDVLRAIFATFKILKKHQTTVVHTHLFDANIVGLTAAWLACVPKRIHTRHHANYHHTYHPNAVKYDKWANRLSTHIVAISKVVKDILIDKEKANPLKIHLIHHGFELSEFTNVSQSSINKLRERYITANARPVIGVISRYLELKGIQYIIPAFKKLLITYPDATLLLANASGDYKGEINRLLQNIPKYNYKEIPFEADIFSLYKLFDIFIHVPIDHEIEAFGQTYVEALAANVPSVFTLSGIANEFICDRRNALVVPHKNSDAIYSAMILLLEKESLRKEITRNGLIDVEAKFKIKDMMDKLEKLYYN